MSNLLKVQIVKGIHVLGFWVPTIYIYYTSQGYTQTEIFSLLGTLQLLIVALEYPTGVIGDIFGPKLSVILGYFFLTLAFLGMALSMSIPYIMMVAILVVLAIGISFVSGSDVALLYEVSNDFKKDSATGNQINSIFQFSGFVIGGFVSVIDLRLPFVLSAVACLIGLLILLTVKVERNSDKSGNLLTTAIDGIKQSFNIKIFIPLFISSALAMYLLSEKWIIAPVFERIELPLALFGIFTAVIFMFRGLASTFYKKYGNLNYAWLLIALVLSSLLVSINYISILGLVLVYGISGYILNQSDVEINEYVSPKTRASVLSFRNLLARLLNAPYLWVIGLASGYMEFPYVNLVMVGVLVVVILLVVLIYNFRTKLNE